MDFLGIFSSALLLFLLLLIVLNIYCIHAYYKLSDKINQIYIVIDSIRKEQREVITLEENKKEINILPENFKNFYYPTSPSSLIEVSSDDNTTSSYETDSDDEEDINDYKIKNVHMSLDLDNLENIHVLLLNEISSLEPMEQKELPSQDIASSKNPTSLAPMEQTELTLLENPNSVEKLTSLEVVVEELNLVKEPTIVKEVVEEPNSVKVVEEPNSVEVVFGEENDELLIKTSEPKELNFKPKKRESRKNMGDGDYKKMNLIDLRKYIIENNINIDASKMKKPDILRAIEELKKNECKEIVNNNFGENEFKDDEIINSLINDECLVDVIE
jgi:hypothetical protein